jgi:hypothetical protein
MSRREVGDPGPLHFGGGGARATKLTFIEVHLIFVDGRLCRPHKAPVLVRAGNERSAEGREKKRDGNGAIVKRVETK